jgi:hypothetical protein
MRHGPFKAPRLPLALRQRESTLSRLELEFDVLAASEDAVEVTLTFDACAQIHRALLDTVNLAAKQAELRDAARSGEKERREEFGFGGHCGWLAGLK